MPPKKAILLKAGKIITHSVAVSSNPGPILQLADDLYQQRKAAYYAQVPKPTEEPKVFYNYAGSIAGEYASVNKLTDSFTVNPKALGNWLAIWGYPGNPDSNPGSVARAQIEVVQQSGNQPLSISDPSLVATPAVHTTVPVSSTQKIVPHGQARELDSIAARVKAEHRSKL